MRVKMSKPPPPAPAASAIGPCPTVIKIVGRPGTGSLPSTIAPPDHPQINEEVRRKIHAAAGEYAEFLFLVKKRKLRRSGPVSSSSGLAKTILQATMKGNKTVEGVGRQFQRVDRNGLSQLNWGS